MSACDVAWDQYRSGEVEEASLARRNMAAVKALNAKWRLIQRTGPGNTAPAPYMY